MPQCNLHQHSDGSLLDGAVGVRGIAQQAKDNGQEAIAITDHNECNQHLAFQKACQELGLHHVFGMEGDWVYGPEYIAQIRADGVYPHARSHICLLAENNVGLSNLWALSSLAYQDQYRYKKPLLIPKLLRDYSEGIYASDGCLITEFSRAIHKGDETWATQQFTTLMDIYGDHFYVELHTWQYCEPSEQEIKFFGEMISTNQANQMMTDVNQAKLRFANKYGVPVVIVNDSHYARKEDWMRKEYVWKFSTGNRNKGDDQDVEEPQLQKADWLMADAELYEWMGKHGIHADVVTEGIKNASEIALSCHAEITRTLDMPRLGKSEADDFRALIAKVEQGFRDKVVTEGLDQESYHNRLMHELSVIRDKGFAGYFMVEDDLVDATVSGRWVSSGANKPLLVGPGRGSAGGCLVSYLLGITSLDPIHYDLLFERFLNPSRNDPPDIDVDFPQSQRPGVKGYVEHRHHEDCVCTIGTLGRSGPKQLLKDLGRALGTSGYDIDQMSRIIDRVRAVEKEVVEGDEEGEQLTWAEVYEQRGGELRPWANKHKDLFDNINDMSGIIRNASKHASGVLVADKELLGKVPLRVRGGQLVTQFDMHEVEELGAVKLDLLGLRHLDTLMHARNLIYERYGVWLDYRMDKLPKGLRQAHTLPPGGKEEEVVEFGYDKLADPSIWGEVAQGYTLGFFQIETPELSRLSQQLQPKNEKDVAALISIVRPGVKDAKLDKVYLSRRNGMADVEYDHPLMEPITRETYGVMIYQEQLLRAVKELAAFTASEAEDLRKALSKKKMEVVLSFKEKFQDGCLANQEFMAGRTVPKAKTIIERIWSSVEASGRYAFNKSHAVGYAVVTTWEIWTKHYYPLEYLTALFATDGKNTNRYVREARRLGISILPPDLNVSDMHFTPGPVGSNEIRYGLAAVKGIAGECVRELLYKRRFHDVADLVDRCDGKKVAKGRIESLIKIGALDSFEYDPARDKAQQHCRVRLFEQYHDVRIFKKAAKSIQAKLDKDPVAKAAHIAAWRAKHEHDESYIEEFNTPDFFNDHAVYEIEQELVGNYVLIDPLAKYIDYLQNEVGVIAEPADYDNYEFKAEFYIGGMLSRIKPVTVKKKGRLFGKEMAFIEIQWNELNFDITVFPDMWGRPATKSLLMEGYPVCCRVVRDNLSCTLVSTERLDITR